MASMTYMKDQQSFLDRIIKKIKGRPNRNLVIEGPSIESYEFTNEPSKNGFPGKIVFDGGAKRDVRFFKAEESRAKRIFHATLELKNDAILTCYFATYCEAIGSWLLCYEQFHHFLGDWVGKENIQKNMRDGVDLLHSDGNDLIRSLLEAITYIHSKGLFHTELNLTSSYVVLSNKVKIINVGLEDMATHVDDEAIDGLRMKDLMGFKDLLKMHILQPGVAWSDRDLFFDFFDLTTIVRYDIFIDRLMKHSFLMKNAEERMRSLFKIDLDTRDSDYKRTEFETIVESEAFEQYLNWDDREIMGDALRRVYEYKDEKVRRKYYDSQSVMELLEFLRDAYRHPRDNLRSDLDKDIRTAYSGFLHRIHEAFCRLIQQLQQDKQDDESAPVPVDFDDNF